MKLVRLLDHWITLALLVDAAKVSVGNWWKYRRPFRPGRKGLRFPNGVPRVVNNGTWTLGDSDPIPWNASASEIEEILSRSHPGVSFVLPDDPYPSDWFTISPIEPIGVAHLADGWDDKYAEFLDALQMNRWSPAGEDSYGNPVYIKRVEH